MNMEERLQAVVSQAETDGKLWHDIVHGDETSSVETQSGEVPSIAKQLKDIRDEITGGVLDVVQAAEIARDEAIEYKNVTLALKQDTQTIKEEAINLKEETLSIKNQASSISENISVETNNSIETIKAEASIQRSSLEDLGEQQIDAINSEGVSQISNLEQRVAEKITLAETQANLAKYYAEAAMPAPLGSKISVPANTKVPDGYEPVWYKNTITRQRYPDFFKQLVDTNYLIYVDETTYDEQVSQYGMCSSYVKLDENTLILPLLTNYARSGTPDSLGKILNDQFQGHWHEVVYRQDSISSGYRADIFGNDGLTGSPSNTSGSDEYMQYVGSRARDWLCAINPISDTVSGSPRYGDETRPKSYYELIYIKCADVSRALSTEETSEIRNLCYQKLNVDLSNLSENIWLKLMKKLAPDWSRKRSLALNTNVTITSFGWIFMRNTSYTSTINGYINEHNVFTQCGSYGNWQEWNSLSFLVDEGDVVKLTGGELIFLPCKGN